MGRKYKSNTKTTRTHQPSQSAPKGTLPAGATGPQPPPEPAPTPSVTTTETEHEGSSKTAWNPPAISNPVGGNVSFLTFLVVVMVVIIEWKGIVSPFFVTLMGGKAQGINWIGGLGIGVFGFINIALSSINDDMAGLMMIVVIGMIAVYMVENNGGAFTTFFNWLQQNQSTAAISPAAGTVTSTGKTPGDPLSLIKLLQPPAGTNSNNSAQNAQKG